MRDPSLLEPFNEKMEVQLPLFEMNHNLNYSSEVRLDDFNIYFYKIVDVIMSRTPKI